MQRKMFWTTFTVLGLSGRFGAAVLVGANRDHSPGCSELVGGVSERVVLAWSSLIELKQKAEKSPPGLQPVYTLRIHQMSREHTISF